MKRRLIALWLVLTIGLALGGTIGCATSTQTVLKLIDSANAAQQAAADTYTSAVKTETDAENACRAKLVAAGKPLPGGVDQIVPSCAAIGVTIPYDPGRLQHAAGPVNALYDGVRAANAQLVAMAPQWASPGTAPGGQDISQATALNLASLFANVIADLTGAGIALPPTLTNAVAILGGQK